MYPPTPPYHQLQKVLRTDDCSLLFSLLVTHLLGPGGPPTEPGKRAGPQRDEDEGSRRGKGCPEDRSQGGGSQWTVTDLAVNWGRERPSAGYGFSQRMQSVRYVRGISGRSCCYRRLWPQAKGSVGNSGDVMSDTSVREGSVGNSGDVMSDTSVREGRPWSERATTVH